MVVEQVEMAYQLQKDAEQFRIFIPLLFRICIYFTTLKNSMQQDVCGQCLDNYINSNRCLCENIKNVYVMSENILCVINMSVYPQSYEEERRLRSELELRSQRLTLELADTKQQIQEGDFRRDNYPNIKRCVSLCGKMRL